MATQTDLGKWMITNGGDYDPTSTYEQLTMVMHENSTYITLKTVSGITPVDDKINYILMAKGYEGGSDNLSSVIADDKYGVMGTAGSEVSAQSLVDYITNEVINNLVKKSQISNVQVNDQNKVPSSALAYSMQQQINDTNSNLGVKYDAETDCLQVLHNDNWTSVFWAGLNPARTWIFMEYLGLQSGALAKPLSSNHANTVDRNAIQAPLCKYSNTTSIFISNFDFITAANAGKKLIIEWSVTNAEAFSNIYVAIAKSDGTNNNTNFYKSTSPITANTRYLIEANLSSAIGFSSSYPNIQIQYANSRTVSGLLEIHNISITD